MASTIKLSNSINWAKAFVHLNTLAGVGGVAGEPSLTTASGVRQFMLGPPFAWPWNRATCSSITTEAGTQDYVVALPTFGWLEGGSISDGTTMWGLEARLMIEDSTDPGQPTHVAAQVDDGEGNITFRFTPVPNGEFPVKLIFQQVAAQFTTVNGLWSPIPDKLSYVYHSGFLAGSLESTDDGRFPVEWQKFIRSVISANDGLTETEVNIFLAEKLIDQSEMQGEQLKTQQGKSSRG
jgi:hypothetical protein